MNKFLSYITLFLCASITLTSCTSDDVTEEALDKKLEVLEGKNTVTFNFDHKMFGEDLKYDTFYKSNGNKEELNITFLKYIISNFQLTDDNGEVFTYPKNEGYFFVDSESNDFKVVLKDVPAGRYTGIKFGLGVDQEKYLRGVEDQQEFWDLCREHNLTWGWLTGYKFINCQGFFTSAGSEADDFQLHIGSHGSKLDNYREVVLTTKDVVKVSDKYAATVELDVEVSKLLDDKNKISLVERQYIMVDKDRAPKIMENAVNMFSLKEVKITE